MQDESKRDEIEDAQPADDSPHSEELVSDDSTDSSAAEEGFDDLDLDELEREAEAVEKPKEYVAYGDRSTLNDIEKSSNYSTATGGESKILLVLALIAAAVPVCFLLSWLLGIGGEPSE